MATGGRTENTCSLINVTRVKLRNTSERPWYNGIVVCSNKIFVINWRVGSVRIHGLQDGELLYDSYRLESSPMAVCLISDSEIAVILDNGLIKIMSTHDTPVIRRTRYLRVPLGLAHNTPVIQWTRDLRVRGGLDRYHGVVSFKGDLVVCGVKENTMCWCIVSSNDGCVVGTIHQISLVMTYMSSSSITAKHNIIYISCDVGSPDNNGVYAYDVHDPSKYKYSYKHKDLKSPRGIAVDQHGSLFVCNLFPYNCIHHLTSECQLVSIITQGIPGAPTAILCDGGLVYVTSWGSKHITIYRTQYPEKLHQDVLNLRKDLSVGEVIQQELFDDVTIHDISVDKGQSDVKTARVPPSGQRLKDSEKGKQEKNPEKDISFIECIKESNFRKIGLLLKNRMVPSKSTIIHAIKEHSYNKGIQCLLRGMANILRKQIQDAIRVWSGYRTEDIHTPVFVVMFSKKTIIPEKMKFLEPYDEYEIVFRNEHTPNEEEVRISEQSEVNANTINMEDIARVLDCIAKNTDKLMNEHSNLSIITASTVKAMGFIGCLSERKLIDSLCIVLYVPLKGIIPMGEKEFPKDIDGISTDVREGEFVFHGRKEARKYHRKLPMGCRISTRAGQSGTLGGFVDLPGGKTGCITAAHVVLDETFRRKYVKFKIVKKARYNASLAQGQNILEIYQPTCKRAAFGKVSQIVFEEGNKSAPTVDAAVIEITDPDRTPYMGMFPSGTYPVIGFTKENPMMYNSGKTRDHSNIARGRRVVKYGCSTNITHGKLVWNGASVRIVNTGGKSRNRLKADKISYPKFFNQMVVKSSDGINFSASGDSGALVFIYHTSSRDLEAIGLLIGGSTHRSSAQIHIVTPIQAVFQQLRLENIMFKRFPDINQGEQNGSMNELIDSRQNPEMHHEISNTRINELKEEIQEIKETTKLEINAIKEEIKEATKLEINAVKEEIKETTKLETNAVKEEIKEKLDTVMKQMEANTSSLDQILRLLSKPGGDAGKG